ncbi:hypothetical protein Vau01_113880 [Virgisporangium aurantiacum]|uniref:Uncharacterized protein n=1 Tax=Virgisporangium aurantiacum TaxID=175570 RepID=A0A8J3ZGU1_9ACTN|nr:hypothetical protein Vau01_113880 [Virgisporangium aurantiacum]
MAVRWNLADGYPHLGFASSVNSSGGIVGQQADRPYLAVYVTDAGEMLLPGLLIPVAGTEVRSVSDDGRSLAGARGGQETATATPSFGPASSGDDRNACGHWQGSAQR